jgi:hypothetical protein
LESRFDSGTTPSFLVFDVTGPLAYTIPITDHPMATTTVWNIGQLERHTAPEDNIIPFASLTPEIVIGWVQDKLNVEEIEAALQSQIDEQRTPTTAAGVPWS